MFTLTMITILLKFPVFSRIYAIFVKLKDTSQPGKPDMKFPVAWEPCLTGTYIADKMALVVPGLVLILYTSSCEDAAAVHTCSME